MSPKVFILLAIALLSSAALLQGCGGGGGTIPEIVEKTSELSTLVEALKAAFHNGPGQLLGGEGPFTVFAPSNDAFDDLRYEGAELKYLLNHPDQLQQVLKYHVASGTITSDEVSTGQKITTLNYGTVQVTITDGKVMINTATVTTPDVKASNGVVHIIDKVLIPDSVALQMPDIPGLVAQDVSLANFATVLDSADLGDVLSGGPLTVFAPMDYAWNTMAPGLASALMQPENKAKLQQVLKYHVHVVEVTIADLKNGGQEVTTLEGSNLFITKMVDPMASRDQLVHVNNARVIGGEKFAVNGVVHLIERVLLPPDFVPPTLQRASACCCSGQDPCTINGKLCHVQCDEAAKILV